MQMASLLAEKSVYMACWLFFSGSVWPTENERSSPDFTPFAQIQNVSLINFESRIGAGDTDMTRISNHAQELATDVEEPSIWEITTGST